MLSSEVLAEGAVNLTCTQGTNYAVALESGALPASQRQMKNGPDSVSYALFQNPGHTQLWGASLGETSSGSGTGAMVSIPVYGLVPAQTTPLPAIYKDNVVITVTY